MIYKLSRKKYKINIQQKEKTYFSLEKLFFFNFLLKFCLFFNNVKKRIC